MQHLQKTRGEVPPINESAFRVTPLFFSIANTSTSQEPRLAGHPLNLPCRPGNPRSTIPCVLIQEESAMATAEAKIHVSEFSNEPFIDFSKPENRKAMEDALKKVASEFGREYPM